MKKRYFILLIVLFVSVVFVIFSPYKNYKPILKRIGVPVKEEIISYIKNYKHHPSREEVHSFLTKSGCKITDRPDKHPRLKLCDSNGDIFGVEIFYDIDHSFNSKEGSYTLILHISSNRELGFGLGGYRVTFNTSTLEKYKGGQATDIPVSFKSHSDYYWNTNQYFSKLWSFMPRIGGHG